MKRILVFAFRGTIAEDILERLEPNAAIEKRVIDSSKDAIAELVEQLAYKDYDYILGMGLYSGRDRGKLRLEEDCSNKFRNEVEGGEYHTVKLSTFFPENDIIKYARGIGISWCNLVSYKLARAIHEGGLSTQYSFLHVPADFSTEMAAEAVMEQLRILLVVSAARKRIGAPFRHHFKPVDRCEHGAITKLECMHVGMDDHGYDCSGLVIASTYEALGIEAHEWNPLYRHLRQIEKLVVTGAAPRVGDTLIFYPENEAENWTHMGVMTTDATVVHADGIGKSVTETPIDEVSRRFEVVPLEVLIKAAA